MMRSAIALLIFLVAGPALAASEHIRIGLYYELTDWWVAPDIGCIERASTDIDGEIFFDITGDDALAGGGTFDMNIDDAHVKIAFRAERAAAARGGRLTIFYDVLTPEGDKIVENWIEFERDNEMVFPPIRSKFAASKEECPDQMFIRVQPPEAG